VVGMDSALQVSAEQFLGQVMPLMVRLFCLPGEQRHFAMAALVGQLEERLESFESVNRDQFLALFERTLEDEGREGNGLEPSTFPTDKTT